MKTETLPTIIHWGPLHEDKTPMTTTQSRIDKVTELYKQGLSKPIIFSVGASYCGIEEADGWEEMKHLISNSEFDNVQNIIDLLVKKGIKKEDLLYNNKGLDTVGESYFLIETLIKPNKFKRFRVVTSNFHMQRCLEIYHKILGTDFDILPEPAYSKLDTDKKLKERVSKREEISLNLFRKNFGHITPGDVTAFETILYTKHKLYSELTEKQKFRIHTTK